MINNCEIIGKISKIDVLRYTAVGIPVINFEIIHNSQQKESQVLRDVEIQMPVIAIGDVCKPLVSIKNNNLLVRIKGFLSNKSIKSKKAVLHAQEIEFVNIN